MNENALDGGEAILQALRDLGIDYIMSSPGSDWGPVWEALARQELDHASGPKYLSCWHELLAVDLAVGYTAMTGRMQAVLLHAGVGLMQGYMGVYGAKLSETPMLVMSGESASFGAREDFDPGAQWYNNHNTAGGLQTILHPLVKWAHQVTGAAHLYESVVRAGEMSRTIPVGPTYLDIPIEMMLSEWARPAKLRKVPAAPRLRPSASEVEGVAGMLLAANNPLVITASAGRSPEGYEALVELAEILSLPVVESFSGDVTSFPKDHPLHQGFEPNALLKDADLVLAVRSRTPWYPPNARIDGKVVVIDESPFKTHMAYQDLQADALLSGDVASSLRLLSEAVRAAAPQDGPARSKIEERRVRWKTAHEELQRRYCGAVAEARALPGITSPALCAGLGEVLPADTVYVDETTVHLSANRRHLAYRGPQSYLAMRSGLGQGLAVALGVKLATPGRPVACLIGDGAFLYNPVIQSFGFSKEANLPILIVIYNNRGYRSMRESQLAHYPDGVGATNDLFYGETINGFDYEELIRPFGGFGIRVEDSAELQSALQRGHAAVKDGKTAIVNIVLSD